MVKRFFKLAAAVAVIGAAVCSCSSKGDFTEIEKEIILGAQDTVLKVYKIDNEEDLKVLRDTSADLGVKALESGLYAALAKRMVETVTHSEVDGVGLAAPQIGINRRVVAVQRFDKEGEPFEVYPNISIIEASEELAPGPEGCLSVPNQRHEVMRHTWVTIQYYSLEQQKVVQERIEGFTAVIFQHEVDHLSGVLYIDRLQQ
jgi:peptide deformylase